MIRSFVLFLVIFTETYGGNVLKSSGAKVLDNEYIAALKPGIGEKGTASVLRDLDKLPGGRFIKEYKLGQRIFIRLLINEEQANTLAENPYVDIIGQNEMVQNDKVVESYEKEYIAGTQRIETVKGTLPNEPDCHLDYGGPDAWGIIRTSWREKPTDWENTPYVWGDADAGQGVDAYVVDTGIRTTHNDFQGRAFHGMTGDWTYNSNPELAKTDSHGHGTHIAGTIGGNMFGLARKATLWAVKVLNYRAEGPWSDTIQGLEWIINRINRLKAEGKVPRSVLNMSLSAYGSNPLLEIAVQETVDAGVIFCNSAGNVANDTCLRSPSKMGSTLSVAATDINDNLAFFSNYGPCTAISAPGTNITSASVTSDSGYRLMSGTSMSTPHVVGIAARYLSQLTDAEAAVTSHEKVKAFLSDTSTRAALDYKNLPRAATPDYFLYKSCPNKRFEDLETTTRPQYKSTPPGQNQKTTIRPTTTREPEPVRLSVNDEVGELAVGLLGLSSIILGAGFGIMGLMHNIL